MTNEQIEDLAKAEYPINCDDTSNCMHEFCIIRLMQRKAFIKGFKACQEMDGWISCSDMLPEYGIQVLTFSYGKQIGVYKLVDNEYGIPSFKHHWRAIYGKIIGDAGAILKWDNISIRAAVNKSEFWVNRAKAERIGSENIDYSKVIFKLAKENVELRCKIHDYKYTQRPQHHMDNTQGCVYCMTNTIKYNEQNIVNHKEFFDQHIGFMYVLKMTSDNEEFYKVGITAKNRIQYRVHQLSKYYKVEIIYTDRGLTKDNFKIEQKFLKDFEKFKHTPQNKFTGHTECLSVNPLEYYYHYKDQII